MASGYRKLGRPTDQRKAMLRSLTTSLLYHGKIRTTETRAKEVRRIAERLITLAVKERNNYTEITVKAKVPQKDKNGKRIKAVQNGKRVTVYNEVDRKIRVDNPSRMNARRKMLSVLYPVTEVPKDGRKKRSESRSVNMAAKMFNDIAPKYAERNGGYTRTVKIGPRKGDAAELVIIELV